MSPGPKVWQYWDWEAALERHLEVKANARVIANHSPVPIPRFSSVLVKYHGTNTGVGLWFSAVCRHPGRGDGGRVV